MSEYYILHVWDTHREDRLKTGEGKLSSQQKVTKCAKSRKAPFSQKFTGESDAFGHIRKRRQFGFSFIIMFCGSAMYLAWRIRCVWGPRCPAACWDYCPRRTSWKKFPSIRTREKKEIERKPSTDFEVLLMTDGWVHCTAAVLGFLLCDRAGAAGYTQ